MGASSAACIAGGFNYKDYGAVLLALAMPPPNLTVSVVVPNYNYVRHLRQRLESIWAQRMPIRDMILLDDASTDDSRAVVTQFYAGIAGADPGPLWNDVNSGSVSRQWAHGVSLAEGDLVWIAEADDFADPDFLATVLPPFEDPEVVLSYT